MHHGLAFIALAQVKRRGIDHHQQLGTRGFSLPGRRFKPGILANQHTKGHAVLALAHMKNASTLPWREITPLIKDLVIRQFLLGVGLHTQAVLQYISCVKKLRHGNAVRTQAGAAIHRGRAANHHTQVTQVGQLAGNKVDGILTRLNKSRP